MTHKVCVIGGSGFAGAELLRLCAVHPSLEVAAITGDTSAGRKVADLYPSLTVDYGDTRFVRYRPGIAANCDLAFLALPHGASQAIVSELRGEVGHIIDLAADFRLRSEALYREWYGEVHTVPELLSEFVFGLPELYRQQIRSAELVAAPGCYVTASALALAPLVAGGVIEPTGIIVDAASGVSGAGRPPKPHTTFCSVDGDFTAYGLLRHRHTPEIEMAVGRYSGLDNTRLDDVGLGDTGLDNSELGDNGLDDSGLDNGGLDNGQGVQVLFTPHLAPMSRGILATCYARPTVAISTEDVLQGLADTYHDEPFVVVSERMPSTKATLGSNSIHITARVDQRTGWVIVISALDNLVKGASGQAVQCANLALGQPESAGLTAIGLYP